MNIINKIFWQEDRISMITNHLEADKHSHWMLQLFIGIEDSIEITVNEKLVKCNCIVVDKNISHSFSARKKVYYSALIEPTSIFAEQLTSKMNDFGYWICEKDGLDELRQQGTFLIYQSSEEQYLKFMKMLNNYLNFPETIKYYDDRITELLQLLHTCNCDNHTISNFADKVALSASRLSHLFKEQIGIPLKSYILLHQMECAFGELLSGKNVTEASMIAGFDTPSHLAGTVKRMMGMPVSLSLKDSEFLKVY
ncbi:MULTISPECIES: helix-turn-helix domain-containing protein [unclassified Clostridioides]|uniref:helix-turn-helix domain-containing protein n=1 Tax=unclassified Clostridioides TaxID=2635829 RepID=UPI0007BBE440|nr:helix-turn-helix domain-containing protein [Clostridioides sp. ZZV14-6387]NJI82090.1 helix-turn-helix domain-containing protein [Clostridioides difficile]CZR98033.1 DNA-binding transcriptional regulator AraC [Clostridioides difficile]CZS02632.1 DNA-binding transcriptional regulator AraC [Clostridioides difficile]